MKSLLFTGLVAAATISSNVSAGWEAGDTLIVSRIGIGASHAIRYNFNAARTFDQAATGADFFGLAGVNVFENVGNSTRYRTFCVEMSEGFVDDPIVYTVAELGSVPEHAPPGPMTEAKQTLINDLFSRYYHQVVAYEDNAATSSDMDMAAAFQLVIWEISHENLTSDSDASAVLGELNISTGAMAFTDTYNSETAALADSMIASLGDGGFRTMANLFGLTNPNNQDMLIVVPTPAIAGLAGLGLVGMRRRRR